MKPNRNWRITDHDWIERRILECGDLSPLSPLADLSASEAAFSARCFVQEELRKAYEAHDPLLPEFLGLAIQTFAEHELN